MIEQVCQGHCWWVAHNGVDVYHLLETFEGNTVKTGQPNLDMYATEEEALAAIPEQYRDSYIN